jgi:Golgi phosphoprotein 3 (GPP34)
VLLADDFYYVAHDDTSGKARLHADAARVGLAAALLAELILLGHITVRDGELTIVDTGSPHDELESDVLAQLDGEREHRAVSTWLAFLRRTATDLVSQRMVREGLLIRSVGRGLLGAATVRHVPADMSYAAWPAARLRRLITKGERMTLQDGVLAGLADAAGLSRFVLWDGDARSFHYLAWLVSVLPRPLREVVEQTTAAVGKAVLTPRT